MDSNRLSEHGRFSTVNKSEYDRHVQVTKNLRRDLRSGGWGLVAAQIAARDPDWFVKAYITRVYPADADQHPYPAAEVYYDVVGVGMPNASLVRDQPFYGRPVRNPLHQIYAASVDMDAVLVRSNDMQGNLRFRLMLLPDSEQRATRICGQE